MPHRTIAAGLKIVDYLLEMAWGRLKKQIYAAMQHDPVA
jgi:hypothetical protein